VSGDADISVPAALLGDPARARVLLALAAEAGVAASTTSEHLGKLLHAGMIAVERHGRHRYYRITDAR